MNKTKEYRNIMIESEIYEEARHFCDDNGIRFVDFIEDSLEKAIYESYELNSKMAENTQTNHTKTTFKNRTEKHSPTKIYLEYKIEFPNHILFIQCGSFFEVYGDDAISCSDLFGWKTFNKGEFRVGGIPVSQKSSLKSKLKKLDKSYVFIEQIIDEKDYENPIKRIVTETFP